MRLSDINKTFTSNFNSSTNVEVLHDLNIEVNKSELTSIVGPSGSGKSTLLNIMGLLDAPDSGKIVFDGKEISSLSRRKKSLWRKKNLGFIFQFHNLLPEFTASENIALAARIFGKSSAESKKEAQSLLERFNLLEKQDAFPSMLSGGQQQRIAIARAIVNRPKMILADEPTGNLDSENAILVFDMLRECVEMFGVTVVMVTHNQKLAEMSDSKISLD